MPENTAASNDNQKIPLTINAWKSKLLDLTKRNRALNFKPNKVSTVTVTDEQATAIFRLLCVECKSLKFKAKPETPEETARRKAKENAAKSEKADASSSLLSAVISTESASGEIFNADDDAETICRRRISCRMTRRRSQTNTRTSFCKRTLFRTNSTRL